MVLLNIQGKTKHFISHKRLTIQKLANLGHTSFFHGFRFRVAKQ